MPPAVEVREVDLDAIATLLIDAYDERRTIESLAATYEGFDVPTAYEVLSRVEGRRRAAGWQPVGWKIGFTNRTLWPRYDVWRPMWARVWDRTLHRASDDVATVDLSPFVRPRLEPEVVFCLRKPLAATDDARVVLEHTGWIAAGFEIVQSHFADWKLTAPDCTAAFGLHGALVVGRPLVLDDATRHCLVGALPVAEVSLRRGGELVDRGVGANVLDSPALALAALSRGLADQGRTLAEGELVTTGTITDAWPVEPGETWTSAYGSLGIEGVTVTFA